MCSVSINWYRGDWTKKVYIHEQKHNAFVHAGLVSSNTLYKTQHKHIWEKFLLNIQKEIKQDQ